MARHFLFSLITVISFSAFSAFSAFAGCEISEFTIPEVAELMVENCCKNGSCPLGNTYHQSTVKRFTPYDVARAQILTHMLHLYGIDISDIIPNDDQVDWNSEPTEEEEKEFYELMRIFTKDF